MARKFCTKCSEDKPTSEFSRRASARDGLRSQCKSCDAADVKGRTPEAVAAAKASTRKWRDANRDHVNSYSYQYRRDHPEAVNERNRRRYARVLEATTEPIDVLLLREMYRDCYLCGSPLDGDSTQEHVIPLSRGGAHCMANLRLAHGKCNSAKKDRFLWELNWYKGPTDIGAWSNNGVRS